MATRVYFLCVDYGDSVPSPQLQPPLLPSSLAARSSVPASGRLLREVPRASSLRYLSATNFSYSSWRLALLLGMAIGPRLPPTLVSAQGSAGGRRGFLGSGTPARKSTAWSGWVRLYKLDQEPLSVLYSGGNCLRPSQAVCVLCECTHLRMCVCVCVWWFGDSLSPGCQIIGQNPQGLRSLSKSPAKAPVAPIVCVPTCRPVGNRQSALSRTSPGTAS